jgi:anti-anti-sigma factor
VEPGKILVSEHDGAYVIKLTGDVRVTLCTSLSNYIEAIFQSGHISEVVVDMLEAEGVDSTTLGLLAKLAIHCNDKYQVKPVVFCPDESLYKTLSVMGLDDVFDIAQTVPCEENDCKELSIISPSVDETREQVLEAHRLLSLFNDRNKQEFMDLIRALEESS